LAVCRYIKRFKLPDNAHRNYWIIYLAHYFILKWNKMIKSIKRSFLIKNDPSFF